MNRYTQKNIPTLEKLIQRRKTKLVKSDPLREFLELLKDSALTDQAAHPSWPSVYYDRMVISADYWLVQLEESNTVDIYSFMYDIVERYKTLMNQETKKRDNNEIVGIKGEKNAVQEILNFTISGWILNSI